MTNEWRINTWLSGDQVVIWLHHNRIGEQQVRTVERGERMTAFQSHTQYFLESRKNRRECGGCQIIDIFNNSLPLPPCQLVNSNIILILYKRLDITISSSCCIKYVQKNDVQFRSISSVSSLSVLLQLHLNVIWEWNTFGLIPLWNVKLELIQL